VSRRPLLRVFCPAGHRLVRIVAVRGIGAVVRVDTRHGPRVVPLAQLLDDTVTVDHASRLTITDAMPTLCQCRPDWIPGTWLRDRLGEGAPKAVWTP
jgi:hypothetical protein